MKNLEKIQEQNKRKRVSVFFYLVFFLFLVLLFAANLKVIQNRRKVSEQLSGLQEKIKTTEQESIMLESRNRELQNNLEKFARENLNLKKTGEKVVVFTDIETEKEQNQASVNLSIYRLIQKLHLDWLFK